MNWLNWGLQFFPHPQRHPDSQLRFAWSLTQFSVLLLPFSTLFGIVGSLIAVIVVWRLKFKQLATQPLYWGFATLTGLMILSSVFAYFPPDAYLGLFNFLLFFFGFAGLSALIQTPAQLRCLVWLLVIPSVPVCLIGLGQLFLGWLGYRQVVNVQVLWIVVHWMIDPNGTPPGRMSSTFFYANVLANYLIITFVLTLGWWIEATWQKQKQPVIFLTITLFLNGLALILTNSRNGWAIAAGASLVFALYLGWRWLVAGVVALTGTILGAAFAPPPFRDGLRVIVPAFFWARLTDQLYPNRPVPTLRATQWKFAFSLAQQRPWLGWGLRSFQPLYQEKMNYLMGHPHNFPLMMLCEVGIPATVLLFGLVGWVVTQGAILLCSSPPIWSDRRDRLLLFSVIVAFLSNTVFNLFDITLFDARLNLMGWLLLAGIWGTTGIGARD